MHSTQMWDLRFATAPMRTLEQHKRGVLSVAWCQPDSDLLLSAAKDNQVFCWNPNTDLPGGEVGTTLSVRCALLGLPLQCMGSVYFSNLYVVLYISL